MRALGGRALPLRGFCPPTHPMHDSVLHLHVGRTLGNARLSPRAGVVQGAKPSGAWVGTN